MTTRIAYATRRTERRRWLIRWMLKDGTVWRSMIFKGNTREEAVERGRDALVHEGEYFEVEPANW